LPVAEPDVTVSQGELLDAVQAHVESVVTSTDSLVAPEPMLMAVGLRLNVQATPVCVIVSVSLPTLSVPVRDAVDVFAATLYAIEPGPVPEPPDATVIHGTELTADHEQPAPVATITVRKAEADVSDTAVADSEIAQTGAACVTEKMRPPMVSVAVRAPFVVFASSA
jgi:hypothetical protein